MDNLKPNILPLCLLLQQKHPLKNETRKCIEEWRQEALNTFEMKIFISLIVGPLYMYGHNTIEGIKRYKNKVLPIFPFIAILSTPPFFGVDLE